MTDYDEAMQLIECGKQVERSHTTSTPSLLGITQLHGNPKQTLFREGWVGSPEEGKKNQGSICTGMGRKARVLEPTLGR